MNLSIDPKTALLAETVIKNIPARIAAAKAALVTWGTLVVTHWAACNPTDAIRELQQAISEAEDLSTVPALQAQIAALRAGNEPGPDGSGRNLSRNAARGAVMADFFANAHPTLVALVQDSITVLESAKASAEAAEEVFFATYNVATVRTQVSLRYLQPLKEMQSMLADLQRAPFDGPGAASGAPIPDMNAFLTWFGVDDLEA